MRAAIFHGPSRPITIEQIAEPRPGRAEVLIKVCRCGICGSDVTMTGDAPMTLPVGQFGHEYAGEVVEVGQDVTTLRPGDRVAVVPIARCGVCEGCRSGNPAACEVKRYLAGGFSEYAVIPSSAAITLPRMVGFAEGALVEPMACGLHALRLARMEGGERVLVIGAGAMALSVVYWARALGAGKIAVLSRSMHRGDVAMEMGADAVLGIADDGQQRVVEALGGAPEIVAECVGKSGMLEMAIKLARMEGTVLSLGMCMHAEPIVPAHCTYKEIRLIFPHAYTVNDFAETARSFDSGRLRPEFMVSSVIALEDIPEALSDLRVGKRSSKVHVDPTLSPNRF